MDVVKRLTMKIACEDVWEFKHVEFWVLFRPTFLSVRNSCVFVLYDLLKN